MGKPNVAEDEVMIEDPATDAVDVDMEPEGSEEGDGAGGETGKVVEKTDAAPKTAAVAKSTGEETPEERNARNRKERQDRKERQRAAREQRDADLAHYQARAEKLEKEVAELRTKSQTNETNAGMQKAMQDLELVESVIAKATEDGDGKKLVEAMRIRDQVTNHIYTLRAGSAATQQPQPAQQQQPQQFDATVKSFAEQFVKDHPWYQVATNTPDVDSQIVKTIDRAILAEGFDPKTQDYWDELRDRVAEKLGNKGAAAVTTTAGKPPASKGGPQVGSGRSQVMPGRQTYTLSAERLNAIREAGKDTTDPAVLQHYAKIYQKYDRENSQA